MIMEQQDKYPPPTTLGILGLAIGAIRLA